MKYNLNRNKQVIYKYIYFHKKTFFKNKTIKRCIYLGIKIRNNLSQGLTLTDFVEAHHQNSYG